MIKLDSIFFIFFIVFIALFVILFRIRFSYPEDYNDPILIIRAKPSYIDPKIKHNLAIFKEEQELFIYFHPDDTDTDGDGVSDADEGDASLDESTARIPIKGNYPNPLVKKAITLHLEKTEIVSPVFREVRFLDPNSLNFPDLLCPDYYLPYDLLSFKVEGIEPETSLLLQIGFTDDFSPSARFYTFQDTNNWQEIVFDFMDANSGSMVLNEGGTGDFDGEINGRIHTILALLYPRSLDVQIGKKGCFIEGVFWRRNVASDF